MEVAFAVACLIIVSAPGAGAQEPPGREIAVIVGMSLPPLFDGEGGATTAGERVAERLSARLSALRRSDLASIPFALALPGVACDELRLSRSSGAQRALAELRALARARPVLAAPYANVRIADIGSDALKEEVRDGRVALRTCVGSEPRSPFVPPNLSIAEPDAVEDLARAGVGSALSRFAVPPIEKRPRIMPAVALEANEQVSGLISARPETQGLAVMVDAVERDPASVLIALADDDRFVLRNVSDLMSLDVIGGLIDTTETSTKKSVRTAIARAGTSLTRFGSFALPGNRSTSIFRTVLARARSSAESKATDRERLAERLQRTISRQFDLVSVGDGTVTFTSTRGSIPVTVSNRADYPVRIRVDVSSPKLEFRAGRSRVVRVDPPGDTITFEALARSTGSFPTAVSISTPDDELTFDRAELSVRSTAANVSAVVLTAGGAVFLLAWIGRRLRTRRSTPR